MLTVLLVDDHPTFRAGLRLVLESEPNVAIVGEAGDAADACALAAKLGPDVVVMDLHLPNGSGLDCIRGLTRRDPATRILVLTMSETDDAVIAAFRAGARGYLVKDVSGEEIRRAVVVVGDGGAVLGARMAGRLASYFSAVHLAPCREMFPNLTSREREVLDLVARGYDNRLIAKTLVLSDKTVRNHVSNLLAKLRVTDRSEAMTRGRDAGLGSV